MDIFILLGLLIIVAGVRYELRAHAVMRRRRRALAARARRAAGGLATATIVALLATSCADKHVKPDLPDPGTAVAPRVVFVDRVRYVAIPADLTREEAVAEGPLSQCPAVAADRKAGLVRANARLREISQIQGTEVKP